MFEWLHYYTCLYNRLKLLLQLVRMQEHHRRYVCYSCTLYDKQSLGLLPDTWTEISVLTLPLTDDLCSVIFLFVYHAWT